MSVEKIDRLPVEVNGEPGIGVGDQDQGGVAAADPDIGCACVALVVLQEERFDLREPPDDGGGTIGRVVVDDDDLLEGDGLGEE